MNKETYIKMCEKAEEIQENHKWEYGDYFLAEHTVWCIGSASFHYQNVEDGVPIRDILPIASMQTDDLEGAKISDSYVWLPRQDQLQEMVPSPMASTAPNFRIISELNRFYDYWDTNGIPNFLTTWEELWLAFVMKEKYSKVWDGEKEEWI